MGWDVPLRSEAVCSFVSFFGRLDGWNSGRRCAQSGPLEVSSGDLREYRVYFGPVI